MVAVYFVIARPAIKILGLPRELLLPIIAAICVIGSFAGSMNFFDVWLMFGVGLFGLFLVKADVPPGPLIMGVILGPMADTNFRRAMGLFQDSSILDVLARPVGSILIIMIIITLLQGIFKSRRKNIISN